MATEGLSVIGSLVAEGFTGQHISIRCDEGREAVHCPQTTTWGWGGGWGGGVLYWALRCHQDEKHPTSNRETPKMS